MKAILQLKVKHMNDRELKKAFNENPKEDRANWRNWGDNINRMVAEELHQRGLIG